MAKVKNKRNSGLADKVNSKKKSDINKKKLNPFEVHINKEKIKVLGKKSKHDRGLPGVSRAKAVQKRKETLGMEMKLMHKTNTFIDRRIGEKNTELSAEERMVARFTAERARQHTKKNIYNLADDEILTHRGQTLEQIEKFDDPRSSDDEEEDRKKFGGLDDEFVSEGHFGGGMLSKSEKDGAKSHKDLIEQLIAESKKRKAEKQKEKEQTLDLTEKLDSEWKDLQPVVFKRARVEEKEGLIEKLLSQAEKKGEDYDKMMRELKFEKRGTPSDGIKTDEKQAKEEKLRLEQLEKERQQRMLGEDEMVVARGQPSAPKHRSAEDLEDNLELEDEQDFMLAYDKDGKPLVPEHILRDYSVPNSKPKFNDGVSDTSSEDGQDEENDTHDGNESDDESSDEQNERKNTESNKTKNPQNEKQDDTDHETDQCDESDNKEAKEKCIKKAETKTEKPENDTNEEIDQNEESDNKREQIINYKKATTKTEKPQINNNKKAKTRTEKPQINNKNDTNEEIDQSEESDDEKEQINSKINSKAVQDKNVNNDNTDESSDDDEEERIEETKTISNSKVAQNNKEEKESVLFQNTESGDASDDEQSDDEGSSSEESEDNEENTEVDDLKDLRMSDVDSDVEIEAQDTERIGSFFDLTAGEGENLKELLADKTPSQQATTIQKLIKSYDPGLAENNKDKLSRLFAHMLQYVNDIFINIDNEGDLMKSFLIFDKLAPLFYDLAHTNKVSSKKFIVELLKEKYDVFKRKPKTIPDLDTLIFFKLVSLLYPTSDFRHPVTTPSLIFMSEILAQAKFNDAHSISRGFFLVSLVLEYTALSKRFLPSAVNFLRGILYLSANTSILSPIQVVPPFKLHRDAKILNIEDDCSKIEVVNKMAVKDLVLKDIDNDFKIRILLTSTLMLKEFFDNCNDLDAQECIFQPHMQLYSRIDLELYPKKVARTVQKVVQNIKESLEMKTYTPLSREKKKPKVLRLYEPDIQEVFTGSKSSKLPREQAERARLQGKIKKEMKGALREIRRDKAYIASVKIRQKIRSDNMRKEKVKQIYKDASIQQGELNKMKRMK